MSFISIFILGWIIFIVFFGIISSIRNRDKNIKIPASELYTIKRAAENAKNELEKIKEVYKLKETNLLQQQENLEKQYKDKEKSLQLKLQNEMELLEIKRQTLIKTIKSQELLLLKEKSKSQKWLAGMITDFMLLPIDKEIEDLEFSSSYSKWDRAVKIRDLKKEIKNLTEKNKIFEYEIKYLYEINPRIEDLEIELEPDNTPQDPLENNGWLTEEEWNSLSSLEKNELAFERYKKRHKTKSQIGRDFEMYVGNIYEKGGYSVEYHGIENGLKDKGIDLIAKKGNKTLIIQCKYWSTYKTIHENHLCQLYGTTIMYQLEHPTEKTFPVFICHNTLSDVAKIFAEKLNIEVSENIDLGEYPAIKCCDNYEKDTMIYHLPFDLNYDKIKNCKKVLTVKEAEKLGYRRAFKWTN